MTGVGVPSWKGRDLDTLAAALWVKIDLRCGFHHLKATGHSPFTTLDGRNLCRGNSGSTAPLSCPNGTTMTVPS